MNSDTLNILLADDDLDDCFFFKEVVDDMPFPVQLKTIHDGEELMLLLGSGDTVIHQVLFLDLNMPRKNGFECLSEIKHSKKLDQLPVIIFSTSFEQTVVDRLFITGAHYFIRKPSEFSQFKRTIQYALALIMAENFQKADREHFVLTLPNIVTSLNPIP
jgi:CheY-like chemotaxis protein